MIHCLYGYDVGFTSPLSSQLMAEQTVTSEQISWVASALVLGQISGSFLGSIVANKLGRKTGCQLCACLSLASCSTPSPGPSRFPGVSTTC